MCDRVYEVAVHSANEVQRSLTARDCGHPPKIESRLREVLPESSGALHGHNPVDDLRADSIV
jgi:hypothetical protein